MAPGKKKPDPDRQARIIAQRRSEREIHNKSYRARALKMFPHICGSCGREFSGKRLRELTVHHKDHNHDNNPPDGSNWELLCLYCHDHEHEKFRMKGYNAQSPTPGQGSATSIFQPFNDLDRLLESKQSETKSDE